MPIPDVFDLTLPVLQRLADGLEWPTAKLCADLANAFHVAGTEIVRTRSDGRNLFQSQVEWARTWLKKAGLIQYPKPGVSRITGSGLQLLASHPQRLGIEFFKLGRADANVAQSLRAEGACEHDGTLEDELRRLTGPAASKDCDWEAVRLINGWGPEPPQTYRHVADRLGRDLEGLLELGRSCHLRPPNEAPLLDAALSIALAHPDQEPEELALELALLGIARDAFCLPGLCEAARRFGRTQEWRRLVRYLADNRGPSRRPRPFGSWFELDVFLHLIELGHEVK